MAPPLARHGSILEMLHEEAEVRVARLAEQLQVSEMTIRRDLDMLERQGKLRRVHGGAVRSSRLSLDSVARRAAHNTEEKRAVARLAAPLLEPGTDVFVGAGSTMQFFAEEVGNVSGVRFCTNSIDIAQALSEGAERDVHVLGGSLRRGMRTLIGIETISMLERRTFDLSFIGVAAIEARLGFLATTEWHAWLVRTVRARTAKLFVLADSSKFAEQSDLRILDFDEVDVLVTDKPPPANYEKIFSQHDLRVVFPGAPSV